MAMLLYTLKGTVSSCGMHYISAAGWMECRGDYSIRLPSTGGRITDMVSHGPR